MDIELNLISKAVQTANVQKMIVKGITSEHFTDDVNKEVWEYCNEYIQKYKEHPSLEAVTRDIPGFRFNVSSDSIDYLFDEFTKLVTRREALRGLVKIGERVDDSEGIVTISDELIALGQSIEGIFKEGNPTTYSDMFNRIEEYKVRKESDDPHGIMLGIDAIDEEMMGIQPHELVTIAGYSGLGKSTISQFIAFNMYLNGYTPMIISLEMESAAIFRKFDTMATNMKYRNLKSFNLTEEEEAKWNAAAERAINASNDIIVLDDVHNCTLEKVYSLGKQYQPDILIIDYITLMKMPGERLPTYEKITALTHALKNMARDPEFPPIISVAQANRAAATEGTELSNIAGSNSISTDSDVVIGLWQDEEMKAIKKMETRLVKSRDSRTLAVDLFWDLDHMFTEPWGAKHEFSTKQARTSEIESMPGDNRQDSSTIVELKGQEVLFEDEPHLLGVSKYAARPAP